MDVVSCTLAKEGFTGPVRVVEGEGGIYEVLYGKDMDLDSLVDFSGWRIMKTRHKSLPANYVTQGHVALTIALVKEHDLKPEDIASVKIMAGSREILHVASCASKKYPRNAETADHSAHFVNAVAITDRALGPEQYRAEKFTDPVILDLIEKIVVVADTSIPATSYAVSSEIVTKDGRQFQKRSDVAKGHPNDPMTDADVEDKVRKMAAKYMPERQIKKIIDTVWNLERLDDVGELVALMVFPAKT